MLTSSFIALVVDALASALLIVPQPLNMHESITPKTVSLTEGGIFKRVMRNLISVSFLNLFPGFWVPLCISLKLLSDLSNLSAAFQIRYQGYGR